MADVFPPRTVSLPDMLSNNTDHHFRQSIYRFVQAAGRLADCREGFAREMGLTGTQFMVLMSVAYMQGEEGVGIAAIAGNIGLAPTHATTEVGRLVRKGLLNKRPSPVDRRGVLINLTAAGKSAVSDVIKIVRTINDILFQDVDGEELKVLLSVSEKLVRNSERALAELRLISSRHEFSNVETDYR
ncbi:winged helix-turn-helix transcriptional regulator [Aureimonas fodinaquatilis]|uniref:Winged helix-turn-helix transcriptional regulator n=1 Tax=Aureimonas fodinaquatilis TaxID=2565783 RepID=A0A5B0DSW2_9HYPH|nr:MarR family winged helix-turn-helix transcriptional regulator [Aureimonas fodinaquatilis]KAA0969483.1 winged helix-turn-helix transcriptional regulator [Aureimonas fodinaquatilis]